LEIVKQNIFSVVIEFCVSLGASSVCSVSLWWLSSWTVKHKATKDTAGAQRS